MKNKKGASLIAVIIAMTIVVILGLGALYISRNNYLMKVMDKESADNFYSAESILNDVTAGLEKTMSDVYVQSYTKVMANYNNYVSQAEMTNSFNTEFILGLVEKLNDKESVGSVSQSVTGRVSYLYDENLIRSFVNYPKYTDYTWSLEFTDKNSLTPRDNILDTIQDGIVLRNLFVTFENKKGYYNEIQTDLKITVPNLGFSVISALPNIADYAIIANKGFVINESKASKVSGNLYAGKFSGSDDAIDLKESSTLDCSESNLVVSNGTLSLNKNATLYTGNSDKKVHTSLWTKNLLFGENALGILIGRTYVQDDTTLQGDSANLNVSGQYFGFSNNVKKAAESSAIIINGKNSRINFSGLDSLVVSGTAFIGTSKINSGVTAENQDVLTGDSVAVKSNQLAYLVPTECEDIKSNPMSFAQYEELSKIANWKSNILNTTISSINRTIKSYGNVDVVPIFSQNDNGTVYLYLSFSNSNSAASFYMDLMRSKSTTGDKLRSYITQYVPDFQMKSTGIQIITDGNYLLPAHVDEHGELVGTTYQESLISPGSVTSLLSNTASSFTALTKKLVTTKTSLTAQELSETSTVYSNLINESVIVDFLNKTAVSGVTFTTEAGGAKMATFDSATDYKGIVIDNKGKSALTVSNGSGIVIATGSVIVSGDWTGLIISGESVVNINGSRLKPVKINADRQITGKSLRLSCIVDDSGSSKTISFLNFFKGGEGYSISENGDTNFDYADIRNCIGFINWKK